MFGVLTQGRNLTKMRVRINKKQADEEQIQKLLDEDKVAA